MSYSKIDPERLRQLHNQGFTGRDIAKMLGVSEVSISQAKKRLKIATAKAIALNPNVAPKIIDKNLKAVDQLYKINEAANQVLDRVSGEEAFINRVLDAVKGALVYQDDASKQQKYIQKIVNEIADDANIALKACAEIRNQVWLQLEIQKSLYNIEQVKQFQDEVVKIMKEVEPNVAKEFVSRLRKHNLIRKSLQLD